MHMIIFFMFIMAMMNFSMEFKHLLSSLACLEFIALVIFMALVFSSYSLYNETFYSLIYIAVAVCEAALGISITVIYTNKKGNEMFKTY